MDRHTKWRYIKAKSSMTRLKTNTLIFNTIISIYVKLINMLNFFVPGTFSVLVYFSSITSSVRFIGLGVPKK